MKCEGRKKIHEMGIPNIHVHVESSLVLTQIHTIINNKVDLYPKIKMWNILQFTTSNREIKMMIVQFLINLYCSGCSCIFLYKTKNILYRHVAYRFERVLKGGGGEGATLHLGSPDSKRESLNHYSFFKLIF